ncbi:hypothetical protein HOO54_15505 [Bacillus sp. WMMC1349]|uniref:hypothetical protein n=1 Tax=Bacillus sp. WMMC1349 TaxID=2736254 RepID=UPI0015575F94|nr:hypothetical protein [Bacillus sp. WMMC1349]NPC93604.1 hypothetical protein [Bacillus sp. WMMC1349]
MVRITKFLLALIVMLLVLSPITSSASTEMDSAAVKQEIIVTDGEYEVTPNALPAILIGLAIRALFNLGRAELANFLKDKGISAYCSRYGKSGPKMISDLICK